MHVYAVFFWAANHKLWKDGCCTARRTDEGHGNDNDCIRETKHHSTFSIPDDGFDLLLWSAGIPLRSRAQHHNAVEVEDSHIMQHIAMHSLFPSRRTFDADLKGSSSQEPDQTCGPVAHNKGALCRQRHETLGHLWRSRMKPDPMVC